MAPFLDSRTPVFALPDAASLRRALDAGGPAAVLLARGAGEEPALSGAVARDRFDPGAHAPGCDCCGIGGRPPAAEALDRLFQARVRGRAPWFDRVLALTGDAAARDGLRAALDGDAPTRARFRAAG